MSEAKRKNFTGEFKAKVAAYSGHSDHPFRFYSITGSD